MNPALADLAPLVGRWRTELYGAAFLPDPNARVTGSVVVDSIEDGAAIVIRQGEAESPPAATWIIGRDDGEANFLVLYADDRGVSRVYNMSFTAPDWLMWRTTPEFSQRFEATVQSDALTINGVWKKSVDGGATWEHDFNIDYIRTLGPNAD
ncbi:MAG TPA: hypothetical protein VG815_18515 [Chloroflexota bacterium]|jgi:hypothetical protein|nr:hypothetical protein [Chloroflexota bacterium]